MFFYSSQSNTSNTLASAKKRKRSGTRCAVVNCTNNTEKNREVSWHIFPSEEHLRKEWIKRIGRAGAGPFTMFVPSKSSKICGAHFNLSGKKSYSDILPKFKLPKHYNDNHDKTFVSLNKHKSVTNALSTTPVIQQEIEDNCGMNITLKAQRCLTISKQCSINIKSTSNKDKKSFNDQILKLKKEITVLQLEKKTMGKTILNIKSVNQKLVKHTKNQEKKIKMQTQDITNIQKELKDLQLLHNNSKFRVENIKKDPHKLHFYTGFNGLNRYQAFENLVKECYDNTEEKDDNFGRPKKLNYSNELFLYFCRLRCGLLEEDLAYRFNISTSTVSRIFSYWSCFLSKMFDQVPIWPSRETIDESMPQEIKEKYPTTRVIIDATEIFVELPSDFNTQSDVYSQYKHHSTAKGVTGCDPLGRVTFVGDLVPGKMSDKELTLQSGLMDLLEEGDSVMCDRGFLLENELKEIGVDLNMPAFLKGREQLPLREENESRQIATFRINIERVFREVKTFRILKQVFPNTMFDKLNEVFKVCCYLVNFIDEPLLVR